jgi:hypothetical protein
MFFPIREMRMVLVIIGSGWTTFFDFPYEEAKKKLPVRELTDELLAEAVSVESSYEKTVFNGAYPRFYPCFTGKSK